MRKAANRATTVHVNDICTSLVSGLPRQSTKTAFDYQWEDDHAAWVASNNDQNAAKEAMRRQELADRTRLYQRDVADLAHNVREFHS